MTVVGVITASSNSGEACVESLLTTFKDGPVSRVVAAFRSEERAAKLRASPFFAADRVSVVVGVNADEPESLAPAFHGCDAAVIVTPHDPAQAMSDDAKRSNNMVRAAVEAGVKFVVYVGSWTVHHPEKAKILASRFAPTEALLEQLGEEKGLQWTSLRSGFFNNNFALLAGKSVREAGTVFVPTEFVVPCVDPRDIGRAAAGLLSSPDLSVHHAQRYDISGPRVESGATLAALLSKHLQRDIKHVPVAPQDFLAKLPPFLAELFEAMMAGGEGFVPQSDAVQRLCGQHTSLDQWLAQNVAMFQ